MTAVGILGVSAAPDPAAAVARPAFGTLGDPQTRLLAGPGPARGAETLRAHLDRLGPLPLPARRADLLELVRASRLAGRGGGEFPVARKLAAAAGAGGDPLVVVNGSEGEPASRKDRTLLEHRPHLVLDGAALAAHAVGASTVVVYLHASRPTTWSAVARALDERRAGPGDGAVSFHVASAPDAYVAGESSAVVNVLEGGGPLPRRHPNPVAVCGVHGRPTVVSNAETLGHLALLGRFGPGWFTMAGSPDAPGSTLLTLAGGVRAPGLVVEVLEPVRLGDVLRVHGGVDGAPGAVLIGGYGGRWIGGEAAFDAPLDRGALRRAEVGLGCGIVAPLPPRSCGLATTLVLLDYLAGQSAGQCGPCVLGLPALADELAAIVDGCATKGDVRRLTSKALGLRGRGDCSHPDGAIALLESALDVFADDAARHARGRHCGGSHDDGWFPVAEGPRPVAPS
ncbi:MAG TPA: NADH-ubiquinone oxidoreductase-F iron-sulfur binding region domain-containing protein [Acidimicrobiales bacterium]|nr:NADH-ubiquinone oxidoreductase-F iron-sulfur binding region domain-containing protein [Acidimicrobiales bacterium]